MPFFGQGGKVEELDEVSVWGTLEKCQIDGHTYFQVVDEAGLDDEFTDAMNEYVGKKVQLIISRDDD